MSVAVRIQEWDVRPPGQAAGEWHAVEGKEGCVRVMRGDEALVAPSTPAPGLRTDWLGVRAFASGSGRRGSMVYVLKYPVPDEFRWEFEAWFEYEHMPMLHEEPTWYSCDFLHALRPSAYTYAAIHYLEPGALTSAARDRSVATPWWNRLKQHAWFDKGFVRLRLRPI